ncbi:MAG: response regulator transcription factor [Chloroflexota bacterium]|nr:response regulator transcription factor [Chloroflexota bacterium]
MLVIDDEPAIARVLRPALTGQDFEVATAATGAEGLAQVEQFAPNLILLDLGLPDIDGVELAAQLRERTDAPIIVLSVRDAERDKVAALDNGANDYVTKPFGMGELMARIRVALRPLAPPPISGQPAAAPRRVTVGDITLDPERHEVTVRGQPVHLSPTEFNLLEALMLNAGKLVTHRTLLHKVWGPGYAEGTQLLRVYIGQLRNKIEEHPDRPVYIVTEPAIGYRFQDSVGW